MTAAQCASGTDHMKRFFLLLAFALLFSGGGLVQEHFQHDRDAPLFAVMGFFVIFVGGHIVFEIIRENDAAEEARWKEHHGKTFILTTEIHENGRGVTLYWEWKDSVGELN